MNLSQDFMIAKSPILETNKVVKSMARGAYHAIKTIEILPWGVALIILFFVGTLFTLVMYFPVRRLRSSITRGHERFLSKIDQIEETELMDFQIEIEDLVLKMKTLRDSTTGYFVLKPIENQLRIIYASMEDFNSTLIEKLYPKKQLTAEDKAYLKDVFKPWIEEENSVEHG